GPHAGFGRRHVALLEIAVRAGGDNVDPGRVAATRSRHDVVEGQVVAGGTILAGELVAQEYVEPRERRMGRRFDEVLERDHARQLHLEARAAHRLLVVGDDVHAIEKHCLDRVLPAPQRKGIVAQRTEVRVQYQGRPSIYRYVSVQITPLGL